MDDVNEEVKSSEEQKPFAVDNYNLNSHVDTLDPLYEFNNPLATDQKSRVSINNLVVSYKHDILAISSTKGLDLI